MKIIATEKYPSISLGIRGVSMNYACQREFFRRSFHVGLIKFPESPLVGIVPVHENDYFRHRFYRLLPKKCMVKFIRWSGDFIKDSSLNPACFGEYIPFWNCLHNLVLIDLTHEIEPKLKEAWVHRLACDEEVLARKWATVRAEGQEILSKVMEG